MPKDSPDKQARLAEALRANLRRRKAQSRAQDTSAAQDDDAKTDKG
jgi:hypothetical protein